MQCGIFSTKNVAGKYGITGINDLRGVENGVDTHISQGISRSTIDNPNNMVFYIRYGAIVAQSFEQVNLSSYLDLPEKLFFDFEITAFKGDHSFRGIVGNEGFADSINISSEKYEELKAKIMELRNPDVEFDANGLVELLPNDNPRLVEWVNAFKQHLGSQLV